MHRSWTNSSGFTIVEILVASLIVGIISMAITTLVVNMAMGLSRIQFADDASSLMSNVTATLKSPTMCQAFLAGVQFDTDNRQELTNELTPQEIVGAGQIGGIGVNDYKVGKAQIAGTTMALQSKIDSGATPTYTGVLNIDVAMEGGRSPNLLKNAAVRVTMADPGSTSTVTGCTLTSVGTIAACPQGSVVTTVSTDGSIGCSSILDLFPDIACTANQFVGFNPVTGSFGCINFPSAPTLVAGPGCKGDFCTTFDGGPCRGDFCRTNGASCEGDFCIATGTFGQTDTTGRENRPRWR
jgi:prepilin-type N-terminal cleavage/methylation domain-containing protein